jgi:hypothetical protein
MYFRIVSGALQQTMGRNEAAGLSLNRRLEFSSRLWLAPLWGRGR